MQRLKFHLGVQEVALKPLDVQRLAAADAAFHKEMYDAAQVSSLWRLVRKQSGHGDRLRHQLGARQAELDAAIAQYNGVLLDAVREASDALGSDGSLKRQRTQQADVLTRAARTAQLARLRFDAGLGNFLAVLEAESPWLVQRRLDVDLLARQLDNQMLLIKALGGGWRGDTIPTRPASHAYRSDSPPNPKDVP